MFSNNRIKFILVSFLVSSGLFFLSSAFCAAQPSDPTRQWLKDVEPIITKTEREVFDSLKTEEDRRRFINLFWRARDPNPQTAQNEFKLDYYERLTYAKNRLGGVKSDRGRIYMILGKPKDVSHYSGVEQVVESELWTYYTDGRAGLPPILRLLFFGSLFFKKIFL